MLLPVHAHEGGETPRGQAFLNIQNAVEKKPLKCSFSSYYPKIQFQTVFQSPLLDSRHGRRAGPSDWPVPSFPEADAGHVPQTRSSERVNLPENRRGTRRFQFLETGLKLHCYSPCAYNPMCSLRRGGPTAQISVEE